IYLVGDFESLFEGFPGAVPLADENQVHAEVVVSQRGAGFMIRALVITDGLFQVSDSILRPLQPPTDGSHVSVNLAQHESSRVAADELQRLFEILQRGLALALLMIGQSESEIRLGQAAPVAALPINFQRAL